MTGPYTIRALGRTGNELDSAEGLTFEECVEVAGRLAHEYPHATIAAFENDRCDYDTDGLTNDEREAVDEAIEKAHAAKRRGGGMARYDEKCHDLATYFLADLPRATAHSVVVLAERIQRTVEDYIAERELDALCDVEHCEERAGHTGQHTGEAQ